MGNNDRKRISYNFSKNSPKQIPEYSHNYKKWRVNKNAPAEFNKGVSYGFPSSLMLFNIYIGKVIKDWLQVIKQNVSEKGLILNTILFKDDQVIVASKENKPKRVV
jgi:hypothetical protein